LKRLYPLYKCKDVLTKRLYIVTKRRFNKTPLHCNKTSLYCNKTPLHCNKTKRLYIIIISLFFLVTNSSFSQQIRLVTSSKDSLENNWLKNLKLNSFLIIENDIESKIDSVTNQLYLHGFFNLEKEMLFKNDSIYSTNYSLGKQFKKIRIKNLNNNLIKSEIEIILKSKIITNEFEIDINKIPNLFNELVKRFEQKGKSFTQFSLKNIRLENDIAIGELFAKESNVRKIDKVVINGYKLFPKSYLKHRLNIHKKTIFNNRKLNRITNNLKSIPFVEEIKSPQILFTKDSTHVYLYLKKKHTNQFDGLIGFNSTENSSGLEFNGYLDLHLENIFNYGSTIDLLWKSNGNENQKFNLAVKTPYIFNSPISPKGSLQLYKQDSTYINIKTQLEIEYAINIQNSISVVLQSETSNNLLDDNNSNTIIQDFNTTFYGIRYLNQIFSKDVLFPIKFSANLNSLFGKRTSEKISTSQTKLTLNGFYNWQLDYKNYIFTQVNSGYLISDDYLDNELFRIGGNNTIRGFLEESVFVSLYNTFNIEYRYLTNNNSYLYSITDFGHIETETTKDNLFGLGLGYAFQTKIGLLNLNYTIGKVENQSFDISKAVVNLKYITTF